MKAVIQSELGRIPGMGAKSEQAFSEWYADLGEKAGSQALMTMALIAGASPLAAAGEAIGVDTTLGAVAKNVGEMGVRYPGRVALADVGAVAGGATLPLAEPYLKAAGVTNLSPEVLELIGMFAGGPTGAAIGSMARIKPGKIKEAVSVLGQEILPERQGYTGLPRVGGKDIRDIQSGPPVLQPKAIAGSFSSEDIAKSVAGYKSQTTNWIKSAMERITTGSTGSPGHTAQREREAVRKGYAIARKRVVEPLWAKVDQTRRLDPTTMDAARTVAQQVAQSSVTGLGRSKNIPSELVEAVLALPKNPTLREVRELASVITTEAVNVGVGSSKYTPSDPLRSNMSQLAKGLNDAIAKSFPGDKELAKAKEMTTWLHDTFSRGPVGMFGQVRKPGEFGTQPPAAAMEGAMRDPRFGPQLAKMGETIGTPGAVQGRSEDYLRSTVTEAYRQGQPLSATNPLADEAIAAKHAERYMNSPEFKAFAKAFPEMDARLGQEFTNLQSAVAEADNIKRSSFFNKADTDPQAAVNALMQSGTKVRDAQTIRQKLGNDDDALDAIKNALVERIGMDTNWDPTQMSYRLSSKDTEQLLTVFMDKADVARMKRIIGANMEAQNKLSKMGSLSPAFLSGRVMGSMLARAAGVHTIQGTSVGAKVGSSIMERWFGVIPPNKLAAMALTDPKWEHFVLSHEPDSLDGIKRTIKLLGRTVSAIEIGNRKLMEVQPGEYTGDLSPRKAAPARQGGLLKSMQLDTGKYVR
jgi:hypothetical protein